jgi:hypothetical protein
LQRTQQRFAQSTPTRFTVPISFPIPPVGITLPGFRQPPDKIYKSEKKRKGVKPRYGYTPRYVYTPSVAGILRFEWGGGKYFAREKPTGYATELRPIIMGDKK